MFYRNMISRLYRLANGEKNKEIVIDLANNYIEELENEIKDCQEKIDNYKMLINELEGEVE